MLPPQETSTVGKSLQSNPYTPDPSDCADAFSNALLTAFGGPYMSVVPLSMMVSKPDSRVLLLMIRLAPPVCQNPELEVRVLNSGVPEYLDSSDPPR